MFSLSVATPHLKAQVLVRTPQLSNVGLGDLLGIHSVVVYIILFILIKSMSLWLTELIIPNVCFVERTFSYQIETELVKCFLCLRPHHIGNTGSRLNTAVKQRRAVSVPGWVTRLGIHSAVVFNFLFEII